MASVLSNTVFSMVGQLAARVLALVFYAGLAHILGPQPFGEQGIGAAFGTLFVVLLEPGLNQLMTRDAAQQRNTLEGRLRTLLGYKLIMLVLVWPLSVAVAYAGGFRETTTLWAVAFAGGTILWGALEDTAAAALTALERLDLESTLRVSSKLLTAGLGMAALANDQPFEVVLGSVCAGAAAAGVVGLLLLKKAGVSVGVSFDVGPMVIAVRHSWPLALHNAMWLLVLRMDQLLASAVGNVPATDVGYYNGAVKLVEALVLFPTAVALAFQAGLARAFQQGVEACSRTLQVALGAAMALCLPICVGGTLLAAGLSTLVYGDRFEGTPALLAVQLWCLPLLALQSLASFAMQAAGRVKLQAVTTLANLCVNLLCNLVLVKPLGMGIMGASVAAVAGGVAACIVYLWGMRTVGLRPGLIPALWRPALASAAMGAVLWVLRDRGLHVLWQVAAGGAAYGAVFVALGGGAVVMALKQARRGVG